MRSSEELELQTQQYLNRAMLIRALGMQSTTLTQQHQLQLATQVAQLHASDMTGLFTTIIKTLRMALQSAMLRLGAWLVLQEQLSAGGMIATSILFGRLLSPLEILTASWAVPQRALLGWARLRGQLSQIPAQHTPLALPRPAAQLSMHKATTLRQSTVHFEQRGAARSPTTLTLSMLHARTLPLLACRNHPCSPNLGRCHSASPV